MKFKLPAGRLLALGTHVLAASKGGISAKEARALGVEALAVARLILTPLLPPAVAPVVGPVLDVVGEMIASPPASVQEAAQRIIEAVSGMLPAEVEIDVADGG